MPNVQPKILRKFFKLFERGMHNGWKCVLHFSINYTQRPINKSQGKVKKFFEHIRWEWFFSQKYCHKCPKFNVVIATTNSWLQPRFFCTSWRVLRTFLRTAETPGNVQNPFCFNENFQDMLDWIWTRLMNVEKLSNFRIIFTEFAKYRQKFEKWTLCSHEPGFTLNTTTSSSTVLTIFSTNYQLFKVRSRLISPFSDVSC